MVFVVHNGDRFATHTYRRNHMSETREQYRERLAWTAYRAFMDHIMDHIKADRTKEYDELLPETKDAMHAEAEAVAAQVLRDVIEAFGGAFTASNWRTDEVYLDDAIKHF